jgi:hypothetical protein
MKTSYNKTKNLDYTPFFHVSENVKLKITVMLNKELKNFTEIDV